MNLQLGVTRSWELSLLCLLGLFSLSLGNNESQKKSYLELLPVFCPLVFSSVIIALVIWPKGQWSFTSMQREKPINLGPFREEGNGEVEGGGVLWNSLKYSSWVSNFLSFCSHLLQMGHFLFPYQASLFFYPVSSGERNARVTYSGTGVFQAVKLRAREQGGIHCWSK